MLIRYSGLECCEIPYYLISMCLAQAKRVLVYDNTLTNALYTSCIAGDNNTVTRGNITVVKNGKFNPDFLEDFDITFVLNGMYRSEELPTRVDLEVINVNMERPNIRALTKVIEHTGIEKSLERDFIVSDIVAKKVSVKTIEDMVGVTNANEFTRPFDTSEYSKYVNMTQSGGTDLKNLNEYTMEYLMSFAVRYLGASEKTFKKDYVKVKGGTAW